MTEELKCTGIYEPCGKPAEKYRQNTQYPDDESNWATLCDECRKLNDAHWEEMWDEFYRGRL